MSKDTPRALPGPNSDASKAFELARRANAIAKRPTTSTTSTPPTREATARRVRGSVASSQGGNTSQAAEPVSTGKEAPDLYRRSNTTNSASTSKSKMPWIAAGAGVIALAAIGTLGWVALTSGGPGTAAATPPGTPEQKQAQGTYAFECTAPGGKQSFARKAPAGSHQFGPDFDTTNIKIGAVVDRLQLKMPCDVSFMAAMEQYRVAKGEFDPKAAEDLARKMRDDEGYWEDVHQNFNKLLVGYDLRNNADVKYASLGMIIDPNAPAGTLPTFTQFDEHPTLGWTLVLKFDNDGDGVVDEELGLRVICDLQPALPEFKFVPTPPTVIPPGNPPMVTVSTTPPPPPPPPGDCVVGCPPPPPPPPPPLTCEEIYGPNSPECNPIVPPCEVTGDCKTNVHVPLPQAPPAVVAGPAAPPRVPQVPFNGEPQGSANNEDRHSPGGVSAIPDQQQPVHDAEPDVDMGAEPEPEAQAPEAPSSTNDDPDA